MDALASWLGWAAAWALAASLLVSLAGRFVRTARPRALVLRRRLGLASAALALAHTLVSLRTLGASSPALVTELLALLPFARFGALALALLALLAATSFPRVNAPLGLRSWRELHALVHPAALLVALHALAGPAPDPRLALALAASYAVAWLARFAHALRARTTRAPGDASPPDEPALTTESADSP